MLNAAHAQPRTPAEHKVVVVVANRLVLSDFQDPSLHSLNSLYNNSSAGLISPNCQGWKNEWSVMLTAGSGTGCRGGSFIRECFDSHEVVPDENRRAGDVYTSRTGHKAVDGSAVFLNPGLADRANAELTRPIQIGALGEALHAAGKKTCVVGNADIAPLSPDRSPAVLAMDSTGKIDVGLLASTNSKSDCGLCSDTDALTQAVDKGLRQADLIVVNFGDTTRLNEMKPVISDTAYASHRKKVMQGLDEFIGELTKLIGPYDRFVVVSFSPPSSDTWNQLTPIMVFPKLNQASMLYSPTTRTHGLIAASDFAPTILSLMELQPSGDMLGRPAVPVSTSTSLSDLDNRVTIHRNIWRPVLWVFGIIGIVSFTGAALLSAFRLRVPRWTPTALRLIMLAGSTGPLAMLLAVLAPVGAVTHISAIFGGVVLFTLIAAIFGFSISRTTTAHARSILVVFILTITAILIDACTNGSLARFAMPSACQVSGFRYYGIGNEYAGMLISMGAMVALFSNKRKWFVPGLGLITLIALGSGALGANYGATLVTVLTFGLVSVAVWRGGFGARHVVGIMLLSFALVMLLALVDARLFGAAGSHAGRATSLTERLGPGYIFDLVGRKILINLGIAGMKHVKGVFFAFVPFLVLWFYFIQGKVKQMLKGTPIFAGLKGILIGSIGALLFNDSGIVFATIMVVMMVLVLLYSLLENSERAGDAEPVEQEGTAVV